MKLRSILSALLALAFVVGVTPAQPASAAVLTISGVVSDATTGLPLDNACVTVGPPIRCWSGTNYAGQYFIDLGAVAAQPGSSWDLYFLRNGFVTQKQVVVVSGEDTRNVSLVRTAGVTTVPVQPTPTNLTQPIPANPPGTVVPAPAPVTVPVEQRIAEFWAKIDALAPTDNVSAADLGQWGLNVIERQPKARLTVTNFRTSTAAMQAGLDRAGLAATGAAPTAGVEQKIADFWAKIDALQPTDFVSAGDLGQWALNVIGREPRARLSVTDFRASTAMMQAGFDSAGLAP